MSRSRQISQVGNRIQAPFVPHIRMILLGSQRDIRRKFLTEALAESGIKVQRLLATTGLHVVVRQ